MKYLYEPLDYAGWKRTGPPAKKQLARIRELTDDPAFAHTLAIHCKKLVGQAMTEGPSAFGDAVIFFLGLIEQRPQVAGEKEAGELLALLEGPLLEFRKKQDERSQEIFADALHHLEKEDFKEAFGPVELGVLEGQKTLGQNVRMLTEQVRVAERKGDILRCARLLSRHIIEFSDSEVYDEPEIKKITNRLTEGEPRFHTILRDMIAVDIYYRISRGIMQGNVKEAIRGIRKYMHVFEGDPEARFFYEIDRLERVLYDLIKRKDLWDSLKRAGR